MKPGPKGPVSPLTESEVARVKEHLRRDPRDYALFVLGCNSAFRASDILALNVGDVDGDALNVREQKTKKRRIVPINPTVRQALAAISVGKTKDEALFTGHKRGTRLTVHTLSRLWKKWCRAAGIKKPTASHTGRKTFARLNYERGTRIEVIAKALNHSSPATTFAYIQLTDADLSAMYQREI